jgi:hypothetical protein
MDRAEAGTDWPPARLSADAATGFVAGPRATPAVRGALEQAGL